MAQIIICAIVGTALGLVAPGKLEVTQGTLTFNVVAEEWSDSNLRQHKNPSTLSIPAPSDNTVPSDNSVSSQPSSSAPAKHGSQQPTAAAANDALRHARSSSPLPPQFLFNTEKAPQFH